MTDLHVTPSFALVSAFVVLLAVSACADKGAAAPAPDAGSCPMVNRRDPCPQDSPECVQDLRAERSRFATCRTLYAFRPYVVSCGAYDGVVAAGIDSATTYYFDHTDGHLVGLTNTGVTTLMPCGAFDPPFSPTD